ncbi:MAG: septation protein IspZ [Bdellovibrio sp.]|nr:septation protein IspZ [Bdellovibrio sp.]
MGDNSTFFSLFLGLLPLLAFVIVDAFLSMKAALITTIVMAIVEAVWTFVSFNELDSVTVFTLVSVVIMTLISYKKQSPIFLKLQPAILSSVFASVLIISYFMDRPYILLMMEKYHGLIPAQMEEQIKMLLRENWFRQILITNTWTMGAALYLHAMLTTVAAFKLGNWWWLALRGIGFYVFIFLSTIIARALVV